MESVRYFVRERATNGTDRVHDFQIGSDGAPTQYALKKNAKTGEFELKRHKGSTLGFTALAFLYAYSGNVFLQACLPDTLSLTSNWPATNANVQTTSPPPLLMGQKVLVMMRPGDNFTIASIEFSLGFTREPTVQVASSLVAIQNDSEAASGKLNGHDNVDTALGNEAFPASIQVSRSMYEMAEVPKLSEEKISTPLVSLGGEERVLDTPALESRHIDSEPKGKAAAEPLQPEQSPESLVMARGVPHKGSFSESLASTQSQLPIQDVNQSSIPHEELIAEDSLPQGFQTVELKLFRQTYQSKRGRAVKISSRQAKQIENDDEDPDHTDGSVEHNKQEEDEVQLPVKTGARWRKRNVVESHSSVKEPPQTTNSQHGRSLFVLAADVRSSSTPTDASSPQPRKESMLSLGEAKTSQPETAESTPLPVSSRKRKTAPFETPAVPRKPTKRSKKAVLPDSSTIEVNTSFSSLRGANEENEPSSANASSTEPTRRRRRATVLEASQYKGSAPKIVFSNSDVPDKPNLMKFLKSTGAKSVKAVSENGSSFLCIGPGELKRTSKLTLSVAYGKTIVTDDWVIDSAKSGVLLDPAPYLPRDAIREQAWGFSLKEALQRGEEETKVLKGWTIHFTPSLTKEVGEATFSELQVIAYAAGAQSVSKRSPLVSAEDLPDTLVIGSENDNDGPMLADLGWTLHSRDLLSLSILRGHLAIDSDEFKLAVVASSQPGRRRRARGR